MGLALPFASEVNYSAWVTVIPEAAFVRDPLGELDRIVADLSMPPSSDYEAAVGAASGAASGATGGAQAAAPVRLLAMQHAMARDAPKLTLCSGTGAAGDALLREAFRALRAAARSHSQGHGQSHGQSHGHRAAQAGRQCESAANDARLLPLYATSAFPAGSGGRAADAEGWVRRFGEAHGTDWSWCKEEVTRGVDLGAVGAGGVVDWRGNALDITTIVHVS